jgi:hypothetical protein
MLDAAVAPCRVAALLPFCGADVKEKSAYVLWRRLAWALSAHSYSVAATGITADVTVVIQQMLLTS